MKTLRRMGDADWTFFLGLAEAEGWRVPESELALLQGPLADCAWVLKHDGEPSGCVTAVAAGECGWIGNLIVPAALRSQGYGGRLFSHALKRLTAQGCRSLWLTASPLGRPLYERHGFVAVDEIERWVRPAVAAEPSAPRPDGEAAILQAADAVVWGQTRAPLLEPLLDGGMLAVAGSTTALLQPGERLQVLGPWYSASLCPRENRTVLATLLAAARPAEICADLPVGSPVRSLLAATGFGAVGRTVLMTRGDRQRNQLDSLVALASLGSIG